MREGAHSPLSQHVLCFGHLEQGLQLTGGSTAYISHQLVAPTSALRCGVTCVKTWEERERAAHAPRAAGALCCGLAQQLMQ